MKKPLIGIVSFHEEEKILEWMLINYVKAINDAEGIPLVVYPNDDYKRIVDEVDGLLVIGGFDVNPKYYNEEINEKCGEIADNRDKMEIPLIEYAYKTNKPLFGICRGFQVMNVALGGSLYQDLETMFSDSIIHNDDKDNPHPKHPVRCTDLLKKIEAKDEIITNSYHHQGIKELSNLLKPMGYSEDGLIEAAYAPNRKCFFGVQWHPELTYQQDDASFKLFKYFIEKIKDTNEL